MGKRTHSFAVVAQGEKHQIIKETKKTKRNWIFNMKSGFKLSAWPFVPFGFGCPGNGCNNTSHRSQSSVLGNLSREYLYIHIHAHTEHVGLYLLISTHPVRPLRNKRDKCIYVYNMYLLYLRVYIKYVYCPWLYTVVRPTTVSEGTVWKCREDKKWNPKNPLLPLIVILQMKIYDGDARTVRKRKHRPT